jgi:tetratricopeptide (TPR) repeat protein
VPRHLVTAAVAGLVLWWSALTIDRNRTWRDEAVLFHDALRYEPPTARLWLNAGNLALAASNLDEAARLYEQAVARAPRDAAAHLNLGIVRQRQGRTADAIRQYERVLAIDPRHEGAARALAALRSR